MVICRLSPANTSKSFLDLNRRKARGNTLEMISIVAGMVSQDWYPEYAKYILTGSDNQDALDAILPPTYRNDGTGS